ncbi:MAG: hypothetical protein HDR53_07550 [Treponema sp.]|nr:hypothetical protein [Treponema sp.]
MKKLKNVSAMILCLAMLCCGGGGVLTSCNDNTGNDDENVSYDDNTGPEEGDNTDPKEDDNSGSEEENNPYINEDVYAPGFYSTQYIMDYVRDVYRTPSNPSNGDKSLTVHKPGNPYRPDYENCYTDAELKNIKYFILKKSEQKDRYDEYAVSIDGDEERIGTNGRIMCFGKEGFLYLCGGFDGTYYGTFFFTKYGYEKFTNGRNNMTYDFDNLNLGHDDISEIFGSAN